MKYFIDTEFIEAGHHQPLKLISIGIVAENGFTYYAENSEVDLEESNTWVKNHVLPFLTGPRKTRKQIAEDIKMVIPPKRPGEKDDVYVPPEFWGYFADYDWVLFCQLFGTMMDLPTGYPMICMDLKQFALHLGIPKSAFPKQTDAEHNALNDAKWNRELFQFLVSKVGR